MKATDSQSLTEGVFVTFDGPNGVGKSSLIPAVASYLATRGFAFSNYSGGTIVEFGAKSHEIGVCASLAVRAGRTQAPITGSVGAECSIVSGMRQRAKA